MFSQVRIFSFLELKFWDIKDFIAEFLSSVIKFFESESFVKIVAKVYYQGLML